VAAAGALGARASVHVRMASTNPAEVFTDDLANAGRVAESLAAAVAAAGAGTPRVDVFLDTFSDIDRGYFVRNGLVDRRYNPRLAGHVVKHLYAALNEDPAPVAAGRRLEMADGHLCLMSRPSAMLALALPGPAFRLGPLPRPEACRGARGTARLIDLGTGAIESVGWRGAGEALEVDGDRAWTAPALVVLGW